MSLIIKYNGTDITDRVEVKQCVHDMYAEQHGDTVLLKCRNENKLWDKWQPKAGDTLEITYGNARTGRMFVKSIEPQAGYFVVRAGSVPDSAQEEASGAWEKITKLQLAKDLAKKHGLELKTYGITDKKFEFLRQSTQKDFEFFENICVLEGDAFLIYNGCMVFYREEHLEQKKPEKTFVLSGENKFCYKENAEYSECTIKNGSMSHTYRKNAGGYAAEKVIQLYIKSIAEAENYAKNMLKFLNKKRKTGYFYTSPIAQELAAGSLINIKTDAAESYNGKVFLTHVRHEYTSNKSKIFFRVP